MEGGRPTMEFSVVDLRAAIREGLKPYPFIQAGSSVHANAVSPSFFFLQYFNVWVIIYHYSYYLVLYFTDDLVFIII